MNFWSAQRCFLCPLASHVELTSKRTQRLSGSVLRSAEPCRLWVRVCVCVQTVCLKDSIWRWEEASSQLQCDICFSLHLSETHTVSARLVCVCLCVQACGACACVYAGGSLVKQLILVISVVNWSPQAVHWPLGRTSSLNCLCRDEYTHAWAHKHTQNTCTHTHTRTHIGLAAVAHCGEITGGSCRGDEPENLCWNQYIIRILAATYEVDWIFVVTQSCDFSFYVHQLHRYWL